MENPTIKIIFFLVVIFIFVSFMACSDSNKAVLLMEERQITFLEKNHVLDNNDNYSADDRFLCYDTRGTVYKEDLGNTNTIEKVEIKNGHETILWQPESTRGDNAAPGMGAASFHPSLNKVVFIHGPFLHEVASRGYYGKSNRTGMEVLGNGSKSSTILEMRDVSTNEPTIPGAHRGGTHRHEYAQNGSRIGFTYDDFLAPQYDRTIGYMEQNESAPKGFSHYFAVLVRPVKKGQSKAGEIEKAYGDAWIGKEGRIRAFIGKVRAEDGIHYEESLFVVEIPDSTDITSANSGFNEKFPIPPKGVFLRRLTRRDWAGGIVRGSSDGNRIAYYAKDKSGRNQIFIIPTRGDDLSKREEDHPIQGTFLPREVSFMRWHPLGDWILSICEGNAVATYVKPGKHFSRSIWLTNDGKDRFHLVVSHDGKQVAYNARTPTKDPFGNISLDAENKNFRQIFVLDLDLEQMLNTLDEH